MLSGHVPIACCDPVSPTCHLRLGSQVALLAHVPGHCAVAPSAVTPAALQAAWSCYSCFRIPVQTTLQTCDGRFVLECDPNPSFDTGFEPGGATHAPCEPHPLRWYGRPWWEGFLAGVEGSQRSACAGALDGWVCPRARALTCVGRRSRHTRGPTEPRLKDTSLVRLVLERPPRRHTTCAISVRCQESDSATRSRAAIASCAHTAGSPLLHC